MEKKDMSDPGSLNIYRDEYIEVCKSYHIHDFRSKLLALLPFASGVGGFFLLTKKDTLSKFFTPVGILGAIVTIGLYVYEIRCEQRCLALKSVARRLEKILGLSQETGQFLNEPIPIFHILREGVASAIIYLAVFLGWLFVVAKGQNWFS